jgi:hypothetical protein
MKMDRRGARHARTLVLLVAVLLVACQSVPSSPPPQPSDRADQGERSAVPSPSAAASAAGSNSPSVAAPVTAPALRDLPRDVVDAVDAIIDARTPQAAITATRTVLERSGVVVTDDAAARTGSRAMMYVSIDELTEMAYEAQRRATDYRATFRDYATVLASLAALPSGNTPALASRGDQVQLTIRDQPVRLAAFMTSWVNIAAEHHSSAGRDEVLLSNAPLYLAALAAKQSAPVDLRKAFMPDQLRLGALDMTLLTAGLRATLIASGRVAPAAPGASPTASPSAVPTALPSATLTPGGALPLAPSAHAVRGPLVLTPVAYVSTQATTAGQAAESCNQMFERWANSTLGLYDVVTFAQGEQLKSSVAQALEHISPNWVPAESFGVLFEALSVLARVQFLYVLHSTLQARTELSSDRIHKAIDAESPVIAKLTAGIPDEQWTAFRQQRGDAWTVFASCFKGLGLPYPANVGDIAESIKSWRASWYVARGLEHVQFDADEFLSPGAVASRLERPLKPEGDHKATDSITVQVKREKASEHPGDIMVRDVEVCSELRTNEPPNLKTFLSAGVSGSGAGDLVWSGAIFGGGTRIAEASEKMVGPGAIASLIATMTDLILSWIQFNQTKKSCDVMSVEYHKAKPGRWSGSITIDSQFASHADYGRSGTKKYLARGGGRLTIPYSDKTKTETKIRTVDEIEITGREVEVALPPDQGTPIELLTARQLTYGFNEHIETITSMGVSHSDCVFSSTKLSNYSGTYSYESARRSITIRFDADGHYRIVFDLDRAPAADLVVKGMEWGSYESTEAVRVRPPGSEVELRAAPGCAGSVPVRHGTRPVNLLALPVGTVLEGKLDPKNPGNELTGTLVVPQDDGTMSVVLWKLRHDGPIRLPSR